MEPTLPISVQTAAPHYLDLLERWNATHALTALPASERRIELIQDACAFLPFLNTLPAHARVLDFGTGMGIPAAIIAIARPDLEVLALDKSQKKIAFVRQVAMELKLPNLIPSAARIEGLPPQNAQVGVAKAVGEIPLLMNWWARHRANETCPLILAKGPQWKQEPIPEGIHIEPHPYELPGRGSRVILVIK